ncbi:MAG: hypothetical protein IKG87_01905 [Clostridia bacterium]|nr:hypothetical protein [Clostridia bacterium]MBR4576505.1 hypothetical protein [Clostridia bacterium]
MSEKDNEFAALDKMLAQMAEETPDVPDDFHARWTEAVKAEVNQNKAETRKAGNRQWRYILSAAAVFAFLIGGTLLTRNDPFFERTNRGGTAAKTQVSETAGAVSASSGMLMTEERETEESAEVYGTEPEMVFSMKMDADRGEAGNGTGNGIADYSAAAGGATEAAMEEAGPEAPMLMDAAEAPEQAEMFAEEEEAAAPEEKTAATAMPTAMPTATPAATATAMPTAAPAATATAMPTAAPAAAETPAGVPAEEKQASFLQDLGIFTLKTLAALAACAAAAFLAALISREIKKKKEGKKNHDV